MIRFRSTLAPLSCVIAMLLGAPAMANPLGADKPAPAGQRATIGVADVELIKREALFSNSERTGVRISLDGEHLSLLAPVDGVLNEFVTPADDLSNARAVTDDRACGIRQYFWSFKPGTLPYLRDTDGDRISISMQSTSRAASRAT